MNDIFYYVTGPSLDKEYGIAAIDRTTGHSAVTMHFLRDRNDAELLASKLNEAQEPISKFCEAFSNGEL